MSRSNIPIYSSSELNLRFFKYLKTEGQFKNYTDRALGFGKSNDLRLDVKDRTIKMTLLDIKQAVWFSNDNAGRNYFNVHTPGLDGSLVQRVTDGINQAVKDQSPQRIKKYSQIFGKFMVSERDMLYDSDNFPGILIAAQVVELPLGKKGKLSGDLFHLAYGLFAKPCLTIANSP